MIKDGTIKAYDIYQEDKELEAEGKQPKMDYTKLADEPLRLSPTLNTKINTELGGGLKQFKFNKKQIGEEGWTSPPALDAGTKIFQAATNLPANKIYKKITRTITAFEGEDVNGNPLDDLDRLMLLLGWDEWRLGIETDNLEYKGKKKKTKKSKYAAPTAIPGLGGKKTVVPVKP
jgi:hypothetical protein